MKKTCAFALAVLLAMPAFAAEKSVKTEQVDAGALTEETLKTETNTAEVKDAKDIAKTDDKKVAEDATKEVEQEPIVKEQKTSNNPKIKFPHGMQLGIGVSGTTGLNGFIGYNNKKFDSFWWKRLGIRFDFASMSSIKSKLNSRINDVVGDEGIELDDNLSIEDIAMDSKHYGVMVDIYPFGDTWFLGGWRISGGYMFGKMDLDAKLHGKNIGDGIEFELGDRTYRYDGAEMYGTANLDWKFNGPYVGTGFDLGLFCGFKIYLDAGVVFADQAAKLDLNIPVNDLLKDVTDGAPQAVTGAVYAAYEDAKADALRDAQKELDKYPYYPIVKLGFMYRF